MKEQSEIYYPNGVQNTYLIFTRTTNKLLNFLQILCLFGVLVFNSRSSVEQVIKCIFQIDNFCPVWFSRVLNSFSNLLNRDTDNNTWAILPFSHTVSIIFWSKTDVELMDGQVMSTLTKMTLFIQILQWNTYTYLLRKVSEV